MFSNTHTMLLSMAFLAKPMFRVNTYHCSSKNKPWMSHGKIFHGLWDNILLHHEIFCDMAKYFAMSLNNAKNIPWHCMEYVLIFLLAHACSFTHSPISVIAKTLVEMISQKCQPKLGQKVHNPITMDRFKMTCLKWLRGFFYACPNGFFLTKISSQKN